MVRALEVLEQTGRRLSEWQREWRDERGEGQSGCARLLVGVGHEVEHLDRRIRARTEWMLDEGWPEEAERIRAGCGFGPTAVQALGYAEVMRLVDGELSRAACVDAVALRTRQFARKQRTWYRKLNEASWIEPPKEGELSVVAKEVAVSLGLS